MRDPITFERNEGRSFRWLYISAIIIALIVLIVVFKPWQYIPQSTETAVETPTVEETTTIPEESVETAPSQTELTDAETPVLSNKCSATLGLVSGSRTYDPETKELKFTMKNSGKVRAEGSYIILETQTKQQSFRLDSRAFAVGGTLDYTLTAETYLVKVVPIQDGSACMNQAVIVLKEGR
ncbi:MAG TPA: hypothetical protein VKE88_03225 [Candidatus Nanoarchaeia archaeon]|nr:hypothetical protein [Candidatus Nanoarchaeia archaeon]